MAWEKAEKTSRFWTEKIGRNSEKIGFGNVFSAVLSHSKTVILQLGKVNSATCWGRSPWVISIIIVLFVFIICHQGVGINNSNMIQRPKYLHLFNVIYETMHYGLTSLKSKIPFLSVFVSFFIYFSLAAFLEFMNLQVAQLYTICRWAHFNVKLHFLSPPVHIFF